MKILTGTHIKEADRFTIENEPIPSLDLMERASHSIACWITENIDISVSLLFFVGKGNNGGDGLAVARILSEAGYICSVCLIYEDSELSDESIANLKRLPENIQPHRNFDFEIEADTIIIDALLGTGVKGQLKDPLNTIINRINDLPNRIISIDLPSGMKSEFGNISQTIIKADITLTLEFPKLAMLLPEAGEYCGEIIVLSIGLDKSYIDSIESPYHYITDKFISDLSVKRSKYAHKGTYGHALLICGSKGMTGAAILATGAALRSGCGLVTLHLPDNERFSVQSSYPSAILSLDNKSYFSELPADLSKYTSIGIGCGLGQPADTVLVFEKLLKSTTRSMVIDADALNILSSNKKLLQYIPANSVLTPHIGELKRLIGEWQDEEHKMELVYKLAHQLKSVIVVKGAHTMICTPGHHFYFNSTGNSGMAKGGSGDVLTGYITGLMARGYTSVQAAIIGVYIHGLAGDMAADRFGKEGMNSNDIIDFLALGMKNIDE